MSSISKATMPSLAGTLIVPHLKIQMTFASSKLIIGKSSLVLVRHLRSQTWPGPVMFLCLLQKYLFQLNFTNTYWIFNDIKYLMIKTVNKLRQIMPVLYLSEFIFYICRKKSF